MESMIERVARALALVQAKKLERDGMLRLKDVDSFVGSAWRTHEQGAIAALEAMRTPTEAMLDEGPPFPYMEKHVWARMIDAALKDV